MFVVRKEIILGFFLFLRTGKILISPFLQSVRQSLDYVGGKNFQKYKLTIFFNTLLRLHYRKFRHFLHIFSAIFHL